MNFSRRYFLAASCGIVTATFAGAARVLPVMRRSPHLTLFLHSAGLADHNVAARLRRDSAARNWSEEIVQVSTHAGFGALFARLDRARGQHLIALLHDSDELAIDSLLTRHGARDRTRHRADGGTLLLTANL